MSHILSSFQIRSLTLKNRAVVAPMCQYTAVDGIANDWHFAHLARFGIGGFGLVFVEATAVEAIGRISYGCTGLWNDAQIGPLKRIVDFLHTQGTAVGIQLAHAGRKASSPIPWRHGVAERDDEKAAVGYADWVPVAPSAIIHSETAPGYKLPHALTLTEIADLTDAFVAAARRADEAGFDVVEIHAAHGYLLNQFLSPVANRRDDLYGGSLENRMRLPLEIIAAVRAVWPDTKPLFVRMSVTDAIEDGWTTDDSIVFAGEAKRLGVDVIDCSSGGFEGAKIKPAAGYQVPLSKAVRQGADIATAAVGLLGDVREAETLLAEGEADLVALARAALDDPQWPLHAANALSADETVYALWPKQAGYAVRNRDRSLKIGPYRD